MTAVQMFQMTPRLTAALAGYAAAITRTGISSDAADEAHQEIHDATYEAQGPFFKDGNVDFASDMSYPDRWALRAAVDAAQVAIETATTQEATP